MSCVAAVVALAFGVCTGCHGGDETQVIDFWAFGSEGERVRPLLDEFERRHPPWRVRLQQIPWSAAHEKLLTAFVGGALPDVFQIGNTWLPELVTLGAVLPLATLPSGVALPDPSHFVEVARQAVTLDSTVYALPWYVDVRVLFYRTNAWPGSEPPATWEAWNTRLRHDAPAAAPDRAPLLLPVNEWEAPVIFAWRHGSTLLRDGARFGAFREAAFRRGFDEYLAYFQDRRAVPPSAPGVDTLADFVQRRFDWFFSGPWTAAVLRQRFSRHQDLAWSTMPLPGDQAGTWSPSIAGGSSLALAPTVDDPVAAAALLAHLGSAASQRRFFDLAGDLPARHDAWDEGIRTQPPTQAFWQQLQQARVAPRIAEWERIAQAIARQAEAAARGMRQPDEALEALDREVDALLEKRRWMLARGRLPHDAEAAEALR